MRCNFRGATRNGTWSPSFLLYISEIGEEVKASLIVYVDDTKVKKAISNTEDVEELHGNSDKIYTWAKRNNMTFNGSKFQLRRYGINKDIKEDTDNMEEVIEECKDLKDLGVIMNNNADFESNMKKVTN